MGFWAEVTAGWHGAELVGPLTGGARNQVLLVRRGERRLVARRSTRPRAALEWELDLLDHLTEHGVGVPRLVPADDGRRHVDGVVVHEFVDGRPPADAGDWRRVADVLTNVHELTVGWPQRPGFASARQLRLVERGGDVRLDAMPARVARVVHEAWLPVLTGPECVVHGDAGAGNILLDRNRVVLLDWDEARVDVPWFDFGSLPQEVAVPLPVDRETLITAELAWETATCWVAEPEYAARRLAELDERLRGQFSGDPMADT